MASCVVLGKTGNSVEPVKKHGNRLKKKECASLSNLSSMH